MPVTFLRTPADYFGIQEAPAQPLFQQTRALADPAVQNQLNFQDQITALRQQRPLARTQAIQNEYNAIFENANRLRQQQEAAKQAEQAVGALVGIAGDQPDYLEKKRAIQSQFPMAALDQRVQSLFNDNDRIYTARQSVEARRQEERERQAAELTAAGIKDVNEAYRIVDQGLPAVGAAKYQLGKGGGEGRGNTAAIKSAIELLNDDIKAMADAGENYETIDGKDVMTPAYKELLDRRNKYRDAYLSEVDRALFPQVKTAAGAGATVPPAADVITPPPARAPLPKPELDAAVRARLASIPADQLPQAIEKERAKLGEAEEINKVWQSAKEKLETQLKKALPDKDVGFGINPLEQFARQVLGNQNAPDPTLPPDIETGAAAIAPIEHKVLRSLGINPFSKAFVEPGERRKSFFGLAGTQDVTYEQLIRDWADKFLKARNLIPSSIEESPVIPKEEVESAANFLKKKTLMSQ
jgi:hypothetical protein